MMDELEKGKKENSKYESNILAIRLATISIRHTVQTSRNPFFFFSRLIFKSHALLCSSVLEMFLPSDSKHFRSISKGYVSKLGVLENSRL